MAAGLKRVEAEIDLWLKDVAPSADLRRWFGHDPARWSGFRTATRQSWQAARRWTSCLHWSSSGKRVTLLYRAGHGTQQRDRAARCLAKDCTMSDADAGWLRRHCSEA